MFGENFDRRIALGMAFITGGGVLLSWAGDAAAGVPWGALAVAGACLAWGIDNNLTRKVSGGNPVQIAAVKGLVAGRREPGPRPARRVATAGRPDRRSPPPGWACWATA